MSRTYSSTLAHTHTGVISIPVISSQTCVLGFAGTPPPAVNPITSPRTCTPRPLGMTRGMLSGMPPPPLAVNPTPNPQTPDLHSQALGDDARDVVGHAASRDVHDTLEADLKGGGERGGGAR